MITVLFVTFDAGGNLPPALGIAQRLLADGDRAVVLGNVDQRGTVEAAGVEFAAFTTPQRFKPLARTSPARGLLRLISTTASRSIAADALRVASATRADVVVVDCMLLRPLATSVAAGFPTVTLVHSLPSFFAGSYARGPVGWLSALRGLPPARVWRSASATIATALPSLDGPQPGPWAGLHRVGPISSHTANAGPSLWSSPRKRPRVLLSLSTVWYPGQERTLQKLLDAVAPLEVDAVMTTGRSVEPADLRIPANAEVHRFVDHDLLLPHVDLVVGHGGHGTAMRALAQDLPMLVIPGFSMTDQPLVGRRLAEVGAGWTLPSSASVPELRGAVQALISADTPCRRVAAQLGAELRTRDAAAEATAVLRSVAARSPVATALPQV